VLETIIIVLFLLWLFGAFVVPVGGAFIHILLVLAVIVLVFRLLGGRRAV
jgi:hypothetical protein